MPVAHLLCSISSARGLRALALSEGWPKVLPALFCTHALKDTFPGDPTQQFLKQQEVCSPKAQAPSSALFQASIPPDLKVHQGMITAAQVASNLKLSDAILCTGEHQVQ